jgi:hypothetical protein
MTFRSFRYFAKKHGLGRDAGQPSGAADEPTEKVEVCPE